MGIILFIVALVLTGVMFAINIVIQPLYYLFTFKWKSGYKQLDNWFYTLGLSVDQFGNVACAKLLQLLFTKNSNFKYGGEDDTVSYITAVNEVKGTLNYGGRLLAKVLDTLDKDHLKKSIHNKIKSDKEAHKRYTENKYFTK